MYNVQQRYLMQGKVGDEDMATTTSAEIVVVGASLAGIRVAESLRRAGYTERIVLIGAEEHAPYDRPPLSKEVLTGQQGPEDIRLHDDTGLRDLQVDLRLGVAATGLDRGTRTVALEGGSEVRGDVVVIATGSRARRLPSLVSDAGVFVLRTVDDAIALRDAMRNATSMVVVGAGFIGAEVASAARERGLEVTVVEASVAPLSRALGPRLGARLGRLHEESGSRLLCNASVVSVDNERVVERVTLRDGSMINTEIVVVGVGTQPNTEWLAGSGLDTSDGVLCDERGRAVGAEHIYAVGDVARWMSHRFRDAVRTEHWAAAGEQAQAVAADILGLPHPAEAVPYVWSDQFGHRIQVAGRCGEDDAIEVVRDDGDGFVAITGRDGRLVSVVAMDDQRRFGAFRRMIGRDASWGDALLEAKTKESR